MNNYVLGEIAALLGVTALAGILIGWCIKSLFSGRTEREVRANVARDVDEAAADVQQMQINLQEKDADLQGAMLELQQLRGRDVSLSAGNTTQVEEINNLKVELSKTRQTLEQNRTEFAAFRNEKLQDLQSVSNQLASFKTGGSVHDKQMNQAHDSIAALRAAARENDKIIESLRARIKEADTSVENLRSQLKQSEIGQREAASSQQESTKTTAKLNTELQETLGNFEKQKRDYATMLETKNRDIAQHMRRLEELGNVQSLLKQKEHDFDKLNSEMQEIGQSTSREINELKGNLGIKEQTIQNLQDQLAKLTSNAQSQGEQHQSEITEIQKRHTAESLELRRTIDS